MVKFKEKLSLVPKKPGSYQMMNKQGIIIYVGKAKDLQKRLKSYFYKIHTGKTKLLVDDIEDFTYIVTDNELESLILEINLIKKYNPKYNILLKDDKTYPYIELTNDKYPILKVIRKVKTKKNKNQLFGPYPNVGAARSVVDVLNRIYPLRKCETLKKDLCLYYHINNCLGYCKYDIDKEEIDKLKKSIISFLKGNRKEVIELLNNKMEYYSNNLNFEQASLYKEMIDSINITLRKQNIDLGKNYNFDLINFYRDNNYLAIVIFFVRDGLLVGKHSDIFDITNAIDEVVEYIIKFYDKNPLPKEILIPLELNKDILAKYFEVDVTTPKKGKLKSLLDLAYDNAKDLLKVKKEEIKNSDQERYKALDELKKLLNVDSVSIMESFDNSHLFGTFYVGAMVSFNNFIPDKNNYRKYKITSDAKDDISAMREVLYRRYYKVLTEEKTSCDLIVMDGGPQQVNVCKEVLNELGLNIEIIGLVKDKKHRTNHIINKNGDILNVNKDSKLFMFLTKIQDEVHRFAITYHRNIKSKGALSSLLDLAPNIGEKRKKDLLKYFGSLKKIKEANIEELSKIIPLNVSKELKKYLEEIE